MLLKILKLIAKFKRYCLNMNTIEKDFLNLNIDNKKKIRDMFWLDIVKTQKIKKTNILSK